MPRLPLEAVYTLTCPPRCPRSNTLDRCSSQGPTKADLLYYPWSADQQMRKDVQVAVPPDHGFSKRSIDLIHPGRIIRPQDGPRCHRRYRSLDVALVDAQRVCPHGDGLVGRAESAEGAGQVGCHFDVSVVAGYPSLGCWRLPRRTTGRGMSGWSQGWHGEANIGRRLPVLVRVPVGATGFRDFPPVASRSGLRLMTPLIMST